jgi:hypothetical protein
VDAGFGEQLKLMMGCLSNLDSHFARFFVHDGTELEVGEPADLLRRGEIAVTRPPPFTKGRPESRGFGYGGHSIRDEETRDEGRYDAFAVKRVGDNLKVREDEVDGFGRQLRGDHCGGSAPQ